MIGRIFAIRPILNYPPQCRTEGWHSLVETYRLYGMLYPEIRDANRRVGYDAHSHHAIGDAIRVKCESSGWALSVSWVRKVRIGHIGCRGMASKRHPEALSRSFLPEAPSSRSCWCLSAADLFCGAAGTGAGHNIFCRKTSSWNPSASRSHSFLIPVSENPTWRKSARLAAFPASTLHHNWCRCSMSRA